MSASFRNRSCNALLLRDDVGRGKPSAYDLPHESHAFGRAEAPDMEGAGDVLNSWAAHVPGPREGPDRRDFLRMNKMAAGSRVTTAKDLAEFRKNNDVRVAPAGPTGALPKIIPSDVFPGFAYGIKARPSTPIHQVLNGDYEAAEAARLDLLYRQRGEASEGRQRKHKVQMTKAMRAQIDNARAAKLAQSAPEPPAAFKMSKYKNVSSRLSSGPLGKSASTPAL
ncbi:unnamed protein product [Prorocentrum cordatum]|uniref:Ribosome biogenesis protein NOP53 n=1 Tax=Prorocentrum cordatum TaxID=2364126 RepID=A0ABN9Q7A2_9DINO|nr:unnamed protein product [Polarella glacialis]